MEKFQCSEALVGKYINQYLWSDANPVGKIVAVVNKREVMIQPVKATLIDNGPYEWHGRLYNGGQKYMYEEVGEPRRIFLSKSSMQNCMYRFDDAPYKYYDYTF